MQVYINFLGLLPQFEFDGARNVAVSLYNGCEVSCIKGNERYGCHEICVRWPDSNIPESRVDGGKFALLQIGLADTLGGFNGARPWSEHLVRMLLESRERERDADAAAAPDAAAP
ncbi:hypothetical protein JCM19000A_00400 [Silvimonas sp. JCM 19000]